MSRGAYRRRKTDGKGATVATLELPKGRPQGALRKHSRESASIVAACNAALRSRGLEDKASRYLL